MKLSILLLILIQNILLAKDIQRQQVLMGTFVSITLDEKNKDEIQKGFQLIRKIEHSLSSYASTALLYKLNQEKNIRADSLLSEAIQKSMDFYTLSNGYFDISIGSVTKKLYHFGEIESIPSTKALNLAKTNINGIHLNKKEINLDKNITLDLGGMGKGFAVDKVASFYRKQHITHGIIALSGDIQLLHPTTFYIDSPFSNKPFFKLKTLHSNTSISTSGTYRRYVQSPKHHHLIDPKSKQQGKAFVSITLIGQKNNTFIDAMATAIAVMSQEKALLWLSKHPKIGYILITPAKKVFCGHLKKLVYIIKKI